MSAGARALDQVTEQSTPPRAETLYTSGTSSAPPTNFNPLQPALDYTGTEGLLYEPLFLYDPLKGRFIDWLALGGDWVDGSTYVITVRPGVQWVNSSSGAVAGPLTATDVAASIELAQRLLSDPWHSDVKEVKSVSVTGGTVTVEFSKPVNYPAWEDYLWHAPVLPHRLWPEPGSSAAGGAIPGPGANLSPVASGPMLLYSTTPTRACYRDNPHWWGWSALHLRFSFRYLCDLVSGPSGQQLSDLLGGRVDWSNALLRGVPNLVGAGGKAYGLKTYYPSAPYMLAAGTAWLDMNTSRAPLDNADLRRAVAAAIDPRAVVADAYMGVVGPARPTGLLPNLSPYIDRAVVKKYATPTSTSLAKKLVMRSGYKGQPLSLPVPSGSADIAAAAAVIVKQLGAVGIKVTVRALPPGQEPLAVESGDYDFFIDNSAGLSATPWDYFDRVFSLPVHATQAWGYNLARLDDPAAWGLVEKAATTMPSDTKQLSRIYAQLEADFLQQVPAVPMWYSGAWFQANTTYWEGYPSSSASDDHYTPVMWAGWLGSTTTVLALAALRARPGHHPSGQRARSQVPASSGAVGGGRAEVRTKTTS